MDLHAHSTPTAVAQHRLEPMLIRLPPTLAEQLRQLARATRIRQSDYLREAVADLLAKYAGGGGVR
jgi:ribbon-helix-helix protein